MSPAQRNLFANFAERSRSQLLETLAQVYAAKVAQAIEWFREARDRERHIFICGNGNSAATGSHFACSLIKATGYRQEKRFRILALTDSTFTLPNPVWAASRTPT